MKRLNSKKTEEKTHKRQLSGIHQLRINIAKRGLTLTCKFRCILNSIIIKLN